MPSSTPTVSDHNLPQKPLTLVQVAQVPPQPKEATWLIEQLWLASGVGLLGGHAKACKTYLAAELSLAVASGKPALGRFAVPRPGPVLFFGAEDSLAALRSRFEGLAITRGCVLDHLAVFLIDVPVLRLDSAQDLKRLRVAIASCKPRLVVLDPFVRLVGRIDENSAADVSAVLGALRTIQRDLDVAILLTHHTRKSPVSHPNQAFRGSTDFAAWSDSNLLLARKDKHLVLTVEHRSAPSPEPMSLSLAQDPAPHLVAQSPHSIAATVVSASNLDPLLDDIRRHLRAAPQPLTTVEIRDRLRRRKCDVVAALERLRADRLITRTATGWKTLSQ